MGLIESIFSNTNDSILAISKQFEILMISSQLKSLLTIDTMDVQNKNFFWFCEKYQISINFEEQKLCERTQLLGTGTLVTEGKEQSIKWKAIHIEDERISFLFFLMMNNHRTYTESGIENFKLKEVLENLPEYIYWKDIHLVYQGCNKHVSDYLSLKTPDDIVGKTDYDFNWSEERIETLHESDSKIINERVSIASEDVIPQPNGEIRVMLTSKSPLIDKQNKLKGILGVSTDITELKNTKIKLQETKHKLEGMTAVSSSIAHELRTPLASIELGVTGLEKFLPILIETYKKAHEAGLQSEEIDSIKFKLLQNVITDLKYEIRSSFNVIDMLLVKLKTKVSAKSNEMFSISECIQESLKRYPFVSPEKEWIHTDLKHDFMVKGDALLVSHVFFNLLKNAIYYVRAARKGQIEITLKGKRGYNLVLFKDTGQGISAEILPKIFNRFFSKTYHGAGVGLTFCKMVMKSLGGKIDCTSQEGEFTLFTLYFPKYRGIGEGNKTL